MIGNFWHPAPYNFSATLRQPTTAQCQQWRGLLRSANGNFSATRSPSCRQPPFRGCQRQPSNWVGKRYTPAGQAARRVALAFGRFSLQDYCTDPQDWFFIQVIPGRGNNPIATHTTF